MKLEPRSAAGVSRETEERLIEFVSLLRKWNRTINLVSQRDEAHLWDRHVADALQLLPHIPSGLDRAVDLGSGAGFPGLVLAIATPCHFDLIESDHRKAAFLREASRICNAHTTIHPTRIEAVTLPAVRLVTARALAPLPKLLPLAMRFLAPDGLLLAPKGSNLTDELTAAQLEWHMQVERVPSQTQAAACILKITEVTRVGHQT